MAEGPWNNWPPPAGYDIGEWAWIVQAMRAARQKAWSIGQEFFPRTTLCEDPAGYPVSYCPSAGAGGGGYTGFVDSIAAAGGGGGNYVLTNAANTVLVSGSLTSVPKNWPVNRWFAYSGPEVPPRAQFYRVVIEHDELNPWGVISANVLANDATTLTLDGVALDDAVVAGQIPSVAALAGKRYSIFREYKATHPSLEWAVRWLEWPNCQEYARGFSTSGAKRSMTDASANWKPDVFANAGKQLMARVGGRRKRLNVTGNTRDTITFDENVVPDAGAEYAVIDAGGRWAAGRTAPEPHRWYRGVDSLRGFMQVDPQVFSHHPDDRILPVPQAASQIYLRQKNADGSACVDNVAVDAFDWDLWTPENDECTPPDNPYAEHFWKAWIRALQGWLDGICTGFVEDRNWDAMRVPPWPFAPAEAFRKANVNHYTRTVLSAVNSGGQLYITFGAITLPKGAIAEESFPTAVHYAVLDENGRPRPYGYSFAASTIGGTFGALMGNLVSPTRIDLRGPTTGEQGTIPPPPPYPPPQEVLDTWVGGTVRISLTWTRKFERRVRNLRPAMALVRDVVDGALKDPSPATPGTYLTRPPSTHYAEYDELGRLTEAGTPALRHGDYFRWVGDNVWDPTTTDAAQGGSDPQTPDRDRLLEVIRRPELEGKLDALRAGSATSGSRTSLTDATKDWFNDGVGGVAGVETGIATACGANSLTDASKVGNGLWDAATGRWVGFVVEIFIAGQWHKRPITTFAGQTVGWTEPLPSAPANPPYRIYQPLVLNRFKGRTVRLAGTDADGKLLTASVVITHNDATTLFFDPQAFAVAKGFRYFILEDKPGGVYRWDANLGKAVKPAGTDARGKVPWHDNPVENEPTIVTRFGRLRHGDEIYTHLHAELFRFLNVLYVTPAATYFAAQQVPGVMDVKGNDRWSFLAGVAAGDDSKTLEEVVDDCRSLFDSAPDHEAQPPTDYDLPFQWLHLSDTIGLKTAEARSHHMWATVDLVPTTRLARRTACHVFTALANDQDEDRDATYGPDDGQIYTLIFYKHGFNVSYRRWGRIAIGAIANGASERIRVGNSNTFPGSSGWPRTPNHLGIADLAQSGWWVTADLADADGRSLVGLHYWNVAGGMDFLTPPMANAAGEGLSGLFPLTL